MKKGKEDSAGIINFGILAAEYARQEQMANYLQKGKSQTNILRSSQDMGNNIQNIKGLALTDKKVFKVLPIEVLCKI